MSHTNTTTNYGLPQFLSSDKPAWMADINVAFADIDGQMKTNADAASAAQTTADDSVLNGAPGYSNLSTYAVGDVVNYLGRVYKCDIAVTTPEAFDSAKWSYYRLSDASAQLDVIDNEIGNTDISGIGDGSITGAISTINSDLNKIGAWQDVSAAVAIGFTPSVPGYLKIIMNPGSVADAYVTITSSDTNENFGGVFANCQSSDGFLQTMEVTVTAGVTYTRSADVNNTSKILYRTLH